MQIYGTGPSQVWGTSTSPLVTGIGVGTGASAYTGLINKYAKILASGSTASLDDQLAAWTNVGSLLNSRDKENGGFLYDINKGDDKRGSDLYLNSDLAKSLTKLNSQFEGWGQAAARPSNGNYNSAQNHLDNLERFSQDDQKKIFFSESLNIRGALVIGDKDIFYADLDGWKADLKQQAAAFNSQQQNAATAASPTVDPAASLGAVSAITTAGTEASKPKPASQAAAALTTLAAKTVTNADIALLLLLKSQDEAQGSAVVAHTAKTGSCSASAYAASHALSDKADVPRTSSA